MANQKQWALRVGVLCSGIFLPYLSPTASLRAQDLERAKAADFSGSLTPILVQVGNDADALKRKRDEFRCLYRYEVSEKDLLDFPGLDELKRQLFRRLDWNVTEEEVVLGKIVPFGLPRRIEQKEAERLENASRIVAGNRSINHALDVIDQHTMGKFNLEAKYSLPKAIYAWDPGSVALLRAMTNEKVLPRLGDKLREVSDQSRNNLAHASKEPPTGIQPPVEIGDDEMVLLFVLQAANDISTVNQAVSQFLDADDDVQESRKTLRNIPQIIIRIDACIKELRDR